MAPVALNDAIINQTNVNIARCQRLIASWLPPPTAQDEEQSKSETDLEEQEKSIFVPEPEILGLGQAPPKDGAWPTETASNDAKLRKQMLGKNSEKKRRWADVEGKSSHAVGSKPRPEPQQNSHAAEESDEEAGRSALGSSKLKAQKIDVEAGGKTSSTEDALDRERVGLLGSYESKHPKAGKSSYLDQLLAEKARKQKRKHRKKKRKEERRLDKLM